MTLSWLLWNTQKNAQKSQKSGSLLPLRFPELYDCLQQPVVSNKWAFSAALDGPWCRNLASCQGHVQWCADQCGVEPLPGWSGSALTTCTAVSPGSRTWFQLLRSLLRREAMLSGAWAVILKDQGPVIACLSFRVSSWSLIPHWESPDHKPCPGFLQVSRSIKKYRPQKHTHQWWVFCLLQTSVIVQGSYQTVIN